MQDMKLYELMTSIEKHLIENLNTTIVSHSDDTDSMVSDIKVGKHKYKLCISKDEEND